MTDYSIMVPVFAETDALTFSKFYFDSLNLKPIYVLDSKRIDRRDEVERIIGREVLIYDNPGLIAESNFEKFAALSPTDWILRIDCDEAISSALIEHVGAFVKRGKGSIKGYDRRQMRWHENGFEAQKRFIQRDVQYRLFDRRKVKFVHEIHTPGYKVHPLQYIPAPRDARIFHLQFVFETAQQRQKKYEIYGTLEQAKTFGDWFSLHRRTVEWQPLDDAHLTSTYRAWREAQGLD